MMTSNSSEPVAPTAGDTASAPETGVENNESGQTTGATVTRPTLDSLKAASKEPAAPKEGEVNIGVGPAAAIAAYNANFKFKAFGKEHELDEFWRPLVKDETSEKKVKELFTRAYAFDDMKTKHETASTEFQQLLGEHQALDKDVRKVMKFRNDRDFDNFFKSLRISDQEVFEYVQEKINRMNLPPEQQRVFDIQAQERQKNYDLEMQNQNLETQFQTQAVQARTMQLDMVMSRPDVSRVASSWDERMGSIGAFRDLVIKEAQNTYFSTGQDLSAEEATNRVISAYGKLVADGNQPQAPGMQQGMQHQPVINAQVKPVIPTVPGRGTSPIKKAPKSLDELRAMAKEAVAQG